MRHVGSMKTKTTPFRLLLLTALIAAHSLWAADPPASPSELLEKGIYAEETKGDLDSAIALYQQLIAEAKTNASLAAQAQLRIGQCLLKKNRPAQAAEAFQQLIRDYPNEKEAVARAREYLPTDLPLGPVSWVDGERLRLRLTLQTGVAFGVSEYRADLVKSDGQAFWRVGARVSAGGGRQTYSCVDTEPANLRPIRSRWNHSLFGDVSAVYKPDEVELQRAGNPKPVKVALSTPVIDNEEFIYVMRLLPLKVGYKTNAQIFSTIANSTTPVSLEVIGKETVKVPAGKFDCFKVRLSVGQVFWYSADERRYLVKYDIGSLIGELVSITQQKPGKPVLFRDDELGLSLSAPSDWVVHRGSPEETKKQTDIQLADSTAEADAGELSLMETATLSSQARQSARAWAENDFKETGLKMFKDLKIRPESWKSYTVSGRSGTGFVADYTDNGKPRALFALYALGAKKSERFVLLSAVDKFEPLMKEMTAIIASYRMTK
jgi:hypothetical protein